MQFVDSDAEISLLSNNLLLLKHLEIILSKEINKIDQNFGMQSNFY